MTKTMIELRHVDKWFGDFQVLKDISLTVTKGERVVICGPSGSGKSTLIRCINRLEEHQNGHILVEGVELNAKAKNIDLVRQEVGMVFQQFNLFPHLSILDNLTLAPRRVRKESLVQAEERAMNYLNRVRIAEQAHKFPAQLSGGQQQRVATALLDCLTHRCQILETGNDSFRFKASSAAAKTKREATHVLTQA